VKHIVTKAGLILLSINNNDSESVDGNWKEKSDYLRNSTRLK